MNNAYSNTNPQSKNEPMPQGNKDCLYPLWLSEKNSINEVIFCEDFVSKRPLKCINGRFYGVDGEISDNVINYQIAMKLTKFITSNISRRVKNLFEALKLYCYSEPLAVKQDEIHLLNGVLKTDGTFIEGKQFCTNRLNIEYHPEIRNGVYYPTNFLTYLIDLLDMDDITTLQEFMGYCLIPSTKAQAMMFIIGNGGEGKSRIGIIMKEIFKNSLLCGTFHRIETDKFFRINLKDKLVMLDDDMKMEGLPSTSYIKNLVTAEIPVDVEAKGMQSEQALLYARFLSFGNGSPKALYDKSDGFQRRLLVLTVKPLPPDRIKDPDIANKFIEEKEKVFIWMYDGLLRLIKNNFQFTVSDKTKRNVAEVMADNCNIIEFLQDSAYISFGTDFEESTANLYNAYSDWCNKNLLLALKKDTFSSWLKSNSYKYGITFTNHIKADSRREVRGYKGIKTHYVSFLQ